MSRDRIATISGDATARGFFIGVLTATTFGLGLYLVGGVVDHLKQRAEDWIIASTVGVGGLATVLTLVIFFRRQLFEKMFGATRSQIEDTFDYVSEFVQHLHRGDALGASEKVIKGGRVLAAWWSWTSFYRWVLGTSIALVVGFIGALTALLLIEQNEKIERQNGMISIQSHLIEGQRRSALIFELTSLLDQLKQERDSWFSSLSDADQKLARNYDPYQSELATQKLGFKFSPEEARSVGAPTFAPSRALAGRFAALSRSFRPYRFLDVEGEENGDRLTSRPLSPERAQLLVAVLNSQAASDGTLATVVYDYADLSRADLSNRVISNKSLRYASFVQARAMFTDFSGTNLAGSDFRGASIGGARFRGSVLPPPASLEGATIDDADFYGALVDSGDWLTEACQAAEPLPRKFCRGWKLLGPGETYPQDPAASNGIVVNLSVPVYANATWTLVPDSTPTGSLQKSSEAQLDDRNK